MVFFLSFATGLGGFSSIDLTGFPLQFFYWVRRFFTKLPITMTTRSTGLTSKREGNCNSLVTRPSHVIPTVCQWSRDLNINLNSSFTSNQTSNIFHLILHTSLSASNLPCINSDITSHTLAPALFEAKVLHVLQSRGQTACLMAGLWEKTTYRSAPFWIRWWWSKGVSHALWKATRGATSEVVRRRLVGRGHAWLLGRQHQLLPLFCMVEARLLYMVETAEGLDVTLNDPTSLRRWILMDS